MPDDTDFYSNVHKRFAFTVPHEYRLMRDRSWFNPSNPRYLSLDDVEWMSPHDICGGDSIFFNFAIPGFAFTGGADHWAWIPQDTTNGSTPVVECPRDSAIARFYAPNFLGTIYRRILDSRTVPIDPADRKFRTHLERWSHDLAPLLPRAWQTTLADLRLAPLQQFESPPTRPYWALMSRNECDAIVHRHLAFTNLDEDFQWTAP
jgi:hypothetical protein